MQYKIIYILEFVKDNLDIIEDGTYDINDIEIEVTRYDDIIYISDLNDDISFEITMEDDHIIDYVLRWYSFIIGLYSVKTIDKIVFFYKI